MASSLFESLLEEDHGEGILFYEEKFIWEIGFFKINSMIGG